MLIRSKRKLENSIFYNNVYRSIFNEGFLNLKHMFMKVIQREKRVSDYLNLRINVLGTDSGTK